MVGRAWHWAAGLALAASALGGPAFAGWPNAAPAQPVVQGPLRCALGIAPLNRRCKVVDFGKIGVIDGRTWYYAFYATHWADRHGRQTRGFPIIFCLQKPATLRLSLWINDEPGLAGVWGRTPPPRPVLIHRADGDYLGFTLKAVEGQDDQRLYRLNLLHWTGIGVLHRTDAEQALVDRVTPKGCVAVDDGVYDWPSFTLRFALRAERAGAACGTVVGDLDIADKRVALVRAALIPEPSLRIEPAPKS
jgi:hypothetical protein